MRYAKQVGYGTDYSYDNQHNKRGKVIVHYSAAEHFIWKAAVNVFGIATLAACCK